MPEAEVTESVQTPEAGQAAESSQNETPLAGIQESQQNKMPPETDNQVTAQNEQKHPENPASQQQPEEKAADDLPISDWSKVNLQLPEGKELNKELLDSFGKLAVEAGITGKQAQALVNWQMQAVLDAQKAAKAQQEKYLNEQEKALKDAWGHDASANKDKILALIGRISATKGCEGFDKVFGAMGAGNSAVILKGMLAVANLLDEDGLKTGSVSGVEKEETALEGILSAYAQAGNTKW